MNRSHGNKSTKAVDPGLSDLIQQFRETDGDPRQFLPNLLAAQCLLGQADSGAILRVAQGKNVDVIALYPPLTKDSPAPQWLTESAKLVHDTLSSNSVVVRQLHETAQPEGQPVKPHVVMVPLGMADIGEAVAAFVIGTSDKATLEAVSQKLQLLVSMLSHSRAGPAQQDCQESSRRLQQAIETLSAVNRQSRFTSTAMAFCNEVASQWQCERVSVGFLRGRYVQLKAMSHTEHFSRKMETVQDIESAMEECLDQDVEILSPAPVESA